MKRHKPSAMCFYRKMHWIPSVLVASALAITVVPTVAAAAVIFDNGAPAYTTGYTFERGGVADDFTLTSAATINSVRFWAYISPVCATGFSCSAAPPFFGINPNTLANVGWGIFSNGVSEPGALLASGLASASLVDLGITIAQNTNNEAFQADFSVGNIDLSAGTYWLALSQGPLGTFNGLQGNGIGESGWLWTDIGSGASSVLGYKDPNYPDWYNANHAQNAFELSGTVTVPEPATWAIMLAAIISFGVVARRSRRRVGALSNIAS